MRGERVYIACLVCSKEFSLLKSQLKVREKSGPVRFCSVQCSGKFHRKRTERKCLSCQKVFQSTRNKLCSVECRKAWLAIYPPRKRSGYWYEKGYIVLYLEGNKSIKEHIDIMQKHIGRELKPGEVVHHINFIRDDNRLKNLRLMTKGEHSTLHRNHEKQQGKRFFGQKRE